MAWTATEIAQFESHIKAANKHFERFTKSSLHNLLALVKKVPAPSQDAVRQELDRIPEKKDLKYKTALDYLRKNFPGLDEEKVGGAKLKGFVGIANEESRKRRAALALGRCYEMVLQCQMALKHVIPNTVTSKQPAHWSKSEQEATELFKKWFDDGRKSASVDRVRQVFSSMEDALRRQDWEVVCYGTPEEPDPDNLGSDIEEAFAFVVPSENAYRMYLGQMFFKEESARIDIPTVTHANAPQTRDEWQQQKKTKSSMDASIVTMIHELCHVRMISGATAITDVKPNPYNLATCKARAANPATVHLALTNAENYAQFASSILMAKHFF